MWVEDLKLDKIRGALNRPGFVEGSNSGGFGAIGLPTAEWRGGIRASRYQADAALAHCCPRPNLLPSWRVYGTSGRPTTRIGNAATSAFRAAKAPVSAQRYVYVWADGIYLQAHMEPQAECMLVLIRATPEGKKELVGF